LKTIAYIALHYGADYLAYAIRSVIDHIDELWVLYSPTGSHGHSTTVVCPDHAADLFEIAQQAAGDKLRWYSASPGQWRHEGEQREYIHTLAPDADVILVLDADEIWHSEMVSAVLNYAGTVQYSEPKHAFRLPMIHMWRSFHRAILHDPAFPTRVIFPRIDTKYGDGTVFTHKPPLVHFGYAQRSEVVKYKLETHGHKNELRPDWYETRWLPNAQQDCHPVGSDFWQPEAVNPLDYLPAWMREHPYFELDVIP
jgi:hypothetical protein